METTTAEEAFPGQKERHAALDETAEAITGNCGNYNKTGVK
ncbi:hypothetical protein ACFFSY_03445 [Paenibacillus aurantiacus]|uniref:Uncharacterized protein n=1 Tax=Paenibacillus aurantiacus TaxID=1936118 RepID=A0ABV5KJA6_9BACL